MRLAECEGREWGVRNERYVSEEWWGWGVTLVSQQLIISSLKLMWHMCTHVPANCLLVWSIPLSIPNIPNIPHVHVFNSRCLLAVRWLVHIWPDKDLPEVPVSQWPISVAGWGSFAEGSLSPLACQTTLAHILWRLLSSCASCTSCSLLCCVSLSVDGGGYSPALGEGKSGWVAQENTGWSVTIPKPQSSRWRASVRAWRASQSTVCTPSTGKVDLWTSM